VKIQETRQKLACLGAEDVRCSFVKEKVRNKSEAERPKARVVLEGKCDAAGAAYDFV
jgi:hypothetical protein